MHCPSASSFNFDLPSVTVLNGAVKFESLFIATCKVTSCCTVIRLMYFC